MTAVLEVWRGDITTLALDAIVNAANSSLLGGCNTGDAKLTKGYRLPARFVIHTVGPVWQGGAHGEDALLGSCCRRCLEIAPEQRIEAIAFPTISTGIYGFPAERAAGIAVGTARAFLQQPSSLSSVVFVAFDAQTQALYRAALETP
jgi:O-acetyl-ADP-ribose deacetylase (regulator of RNase III)